MTSVQRSLSVVAVLVLGSVVARAATDWDWFYEAPPKGFDGRTSMVKGGDHYRLYRNVWLHKKVYYALLGATGSRADIQQHISTNLGIYLLPALNHTKMVESMKVGLMPGITVLVDVPYPLFVENIGHWAEVLLPLYSVLQTGTWRKHFEDNVYVENILFINLKRSQMQPLYWVWEILKMAVEGVVPPGYELPRLVYFDDIDGIELTTWLAIQTVLVPNDRYMHPKEKSGFATAELAERFRAAAYRRAGLQVQPALRTMMLLSNPGAEIIQNHDQLLQGLREVASQIGFTVRPYSITTGAGFKSHVAAMAKTGVLVSRHGPLLADSMFLPPGAVVLELLPYNWGTRGISQIYFNITRTMGDVHHFAWRAWESKWVAYQSEQDAKYAGWTPDECISRECTEVHARTPMIADVEAIQALLLEVLPKAYSGASVQQLQKPWPQFEYKGGTGLWFDVLNKQA